MTYSNAVPSLLTEKLLKQNGKAKMIGSLYFFAHRTFPQPVPKKKNEDETENSSWVSLGRKKKKEEKSAAEKLKKTQERTWAVVEEFQAESYKMQKKANSKFLAAFAPMQDFVEVKVLFEYVKMLFGVNKSRDAEELGVTKSFFTAPLFGRNRRFPIA